MFCTDSCASSLMYHYLILMCGIWQLCLHRHAILQFQFFVESTSCSDKLRLTDSKSRKVVKTKSKKTNEIEIIENDLTEGRLAWSAFGSKSSASDVAVVTLDDIDSTGSSDEEVMSLGERKVASSKKSQAQLQAKTKLSGTKRKVDQTKSVLREVAVTTGIVHSSTYLRDPTFSSLHGLGKLLHSKLSKCMWLIAIVWLTHSHVQIKSAPQTRTWMKWSIDARWLPWVRCWLICNSTASVSFRFVNGYRQVWLHWSDHYVNTDNMAILGGLTASNSDQLALQQLEVRHHSLFVRLFTLCFALLCLDELSIL